MVVYAEVTNKDDQFDSNLRPEGAPITFLTFVSELPISCFVARSLLIEKPNTSTTKKVRWNLVAAPSVRPFLVV